MITLLAHWPLYFGGFIVLLFLGKLFSQQLFLVGHWFLRFGLAVAALFAVNFVGNRFGFHLGINPFTTSVVAFLGIPGLLALGALHGLV